MLDVFCNDGTVIFQLRLLISTVSSEIIPAAAIHILLIKLSLELDKYFSITSSKLLKSEFLKGFDDLRIKEYRNSFNTLQSFTHYKIKIPNKDVSLKVSGNYSISVHDDLEFIENLKFQELL